jgi:hypothetical protein
MDTGREEDRRMITGMSNERLAGLLFAHMRNLWTVDGLYFLGIEEMFGTESATSIDRKVWEVMGKIEARRLREVLDITENDIPAFIDALRHTSWALDLENKEIEIQKDKVVFRNVECRTQLVRSKKGLTEFPCKRVRLGYLMAFAKEFNPDIEVKCNICPPDEHPETVWCEWEFSISPK